jgi:hypothetical protein
MESQLFQCVEAFTCDVDGVPVTVTPGQIAREGHAVLKGREMFFKPVEVTYDVAAKKSGQK